AQRRRHGAGAARADPARASAQHNRARPPCSAPAANDPGAAAIETGTRAAAPGLPAHTPPFGHTLGVAASCGDAAVRTIVVRCEDFGPHFGYAAPMRFASHLRCRKVWPHRARSTPMKRPAKRARRL